MPHSSLRRLKLKKDVGRTAPGRRLLEEPFDAQGSAPTSKDICTQKPYAMGRRITRKQTFDNREVMDPQEYVKMLM